MKKTVIVFILAALLCPIFLTSCNSYKGEINVFNWGEYISDGSEGSADVIKEFEKEYNIKVNYTEYETNEELYSTLTSSNSTYDVVIPSDYMIAKLIKENLIQKLNFDNIPNYANISDEYKNLYFDEKNEYSVPYLAGAVALVYNTDMIKQKPTSWKILWDEQYAGKILMIDNSRDALSVSLLCKGLNPAVVTKDDIDTACAYLAEQKPLLKGYVMDKVFNEMENNQAAVAPYYAGDIAFMMGNNDKLSFALPEEGTNIFVDSMCVPVSSKNKEYAEMFINYMASAEAAFASCDYVGYSTPNKEAYKLLDEETRNNELVYPSEEYLKKCFYFADLPNDVYQYMQEEFLKVKS